MNGTERPVDRAMEEERGEKRVIREFWLREARQYVEDFPEDDDPIYLTLSGAEGRDIQLFVDHGLLRLEESGAVAQEDQTKIVAVESSSQALLQLRRRFPGLKIVGKNFQDVVGGPNLFNWPGREDKAHCRARVVNLDLNGSLKAVREQGQIVFPVITWIDKLTRLHARDPQRNWTLCLTLHGELQWDTDVCSFIQQFLQDNFEREPSFADACKKLLGVTLVTEIGAAAPIDFSTLPLATQQQVLMVVVPKLIAQRVHDQGWRLRTVRNLRYGGGDHAPMVTWVMRLTWDADALASPGATLREALTGIFHAVGSISKEGRIEEGR